MLVCLLYCDSSWWDGGRLNESQTVFCEPCEVSRVDEQYPGLPWSMSPKWLSATWPPFLSASLCHHSTYSGPRYDSCPFIKHGLFRWSLNNSDIALLAIFRMNDFSCHTGALVCARQRQGPPAIPLCFNQIEVKALLSWAELSMYLLRTLNHVR